MTTTTDRAVQVSKPGRLELVERELTAPLPDGREKQSLMCVSSLRELYARAMIA
jgi:hypothetical protein